MLKYIILIFSIYPLHCMESPSTSILEYDDHENHALLYDCLTIYDPYVLNKKNISYYLQTIHNSLIPSGKFYGLIRTQTNTVPLPEEAFFNVYSQIYQLVNHESQQIIQPEDLPTIMNLKETYLTDDELKEIIWSHGYHIISYTNQFYENIIQNKCEYKRALKEAFNSKVCKYNLPEETRKKFKQQLIKSITKQSKKNDSKQIIEEWNFTAIELCKAENPRPSLYLNDSLLSEEGTLQNDKK